VSRNNIGRPIVPSGQGITVTFALKNGETRSYRYEGQAALQILSGADPVHFSGDQVATRFGNPGDVMDAVELSAHGADVLAAL
jgi:hypothetical protein